LETQSWLQFAKERKYIDEIKFDVLFEQTVQVAKLIHYMINNPGKFSSKE